MDDGSGERESFSARRTKADEERIMDVASEMSAACDFHETSVDVALITIRERASDNLPV